MRELKQARTYSWSVRVYYEDTDHGGVVYYANYLKFMERCRTEFLRYIGWEQDTLVSDFDLVFAVRRVEVDYRAPAKFNDLLWVTARISQANKARIQFEQAVFRASDNESLFVDGLADYKKLENCGVLLCEAKVSVVSLSASLFRPKRIPDILFKELQCEH